MKIVNRKISELKPAEYNPNVMAEADIKQLMRSLEQFKAVQPAIINVYPGRKDIIVGGHWRIEAAKRLGWKTFPCIEVTLRLAEERQLNIRLNKNHGEFDQNLLQEFFQASELLDLGFNEAELPWLPAPEATEDDVPAVPTEPRTKPGDYYVLGERHGILCGDSTDHDTWERLMIDGSIAKLAVTSPPYGVGKEYEAKGIGGWLRNVGAVVSILATKADIVAWNVGDLYTTGTQAIESLLARSIDLFAQNGMKPLWVRIWEKQGINFGVGPYHTVTNKPAQQFEYIAALGKDDGGFQAPDLSDWEYTMAFARAKHKFVKRLTPPERRAWGYAGIWRINTVRANDDHPAMFPVELPSRIIKMHSDPEDLVIDPFMGSGTTMIACEQTSRKSAGIEREPRYVDVAVERWCKTTGQRRITLNNKSTTWNT